jgi:hypothetical protein
LLILCLTLTGCGTKPKSPPLIVPSNASGDAGGPVAAPLAIRLDPKNYNAIEVTGLDARELFELAKSDPDHADWVKLFSLRVAKDAPPVAGSYAILDAVIHFEPSFPFLPGVTYNAEFHPNRLPTRRKLPPQPPVTATFKLEKPDSPPTLVEQIYPTAETLPENQLKFYIHFSAPMSRGEAYDHIKLLDANGKEIPSVFLELGEELWDPSGKRFTLLFDPGRIKHGLKPREDLGPTMEAGKTYTLVIDKGWTDGNGNPLKEGARKTIKAGPALNKPVDPKTWKLDAPKADTTDSLSVTLPVSHDHALLLREVWVTDASGQRLPGKVSVTEHETRWQFTPETLWKAGEYKLVAKKTLEDLAGNRIGRLFEVDVFEKIDKEIKSETAEVPFVVK